LPFATLIIIFTLTHMPSPLKGEGKKEEREKRGKVATQERGKRKIQKAKPDPINREGVFLFLISCRGIGQETLPVALFYCKTCKGLL